LRLRGGNHDDKYYEVADELLIMDEGKLFPIEKNI
jgi:ABC-type siderophore export system fused ATPase/permease subunit